MSEGLILAQAGTWSWEKWMYLTVPLAFYSMCVLALLAGGRTEEPNLFRFFFRQISDSLQRLTGYQGWSMAGALTGLLFLLLAAIGVYWDVAWHIDLGRDTQLFTPPHVMILVGLGGIGFAAAIATVFATIDRADVGFSMLGLRVPWSALTLGAMSVGAVAAFPLDNLWHEAYGLDVTLWSPTHLQLLGGGSLATIGVWLMIAEGRRSAAPTAVGRAVAVMAAGATLTGMSTFQMEFDYGVPQFQLLYLPLLIAAAAGFTLVLARLALGPFGALKAVAFFVGLRLVVGFLVAGTLGHTFPYFPLYLASALAVEGAALLVSPTRRLRFALVAGGLVGTVGLAGEIAYVMISQWSPGFPGLLVKTAVFGPLAALGAAVIGAGLARAFSPGEERVPVAALALAGVALLAALAYPLPRNVGKVDAVIRLDRTEGEATVEVLLDPPDAALRATAFAVSSWQGGGRVTALLEEVEPGRYVASQPVPIFGNWKTVVALNRGDEVMAAPVYMPEDPEISAVAVPALPERRATFVRNTDLLLREAHDGPPLPAMLAYMGWGTSVAVWVALLALTASRTEPRRDESWAPPPGGVSSEPGALVGSAVWSPGSWQNWEAR